MDERYVHFQKGACHTDSSYDTLDSTRATSVVYEELSIADNQGVVSIQTINQPQPETDQEREHVHDNDEQNKYFLIKKRTLIIGTSAIAFVFVAQIATCCLVGLYIAKASTDSSTNVSGGGILDSTVDPQSSTPVQRHWSAWSSWDICSVTCGTGLQKREKTCVNQNLDSGGYWCNGEGVEYRICWTNPCTDIATAFTVADPTDRVNDYLTFAEEISNIGGAFNKSTGIFTCRTPGVYVFSISLVKRELETRTRCALFKNYVYILEGYIKEKGNITHKGDNDALHTAVLHLHRGDKVGLKKCTDPVTSMEFWTSFSGFLLHPDA